MVALFTEKWFTSDSTLLPLGTAVLSPAHQSLGLTNLTPMTIVDLVKMVCLQNFQKTAPPPNTNTYRLVAFISSTSEIQFESLYPSSTCCSEFHSSLCLLDSALLFQKPSNDHLPGLKQTGTVCLQQMRCQ